MSKFLNRIQVFEHGTLLYGRSYQGVLFEEKHFNALAKLNQLNDNKYFTLVHRGVKFSQYVGVLQIDGLCIEILPKIDGGSTSEKLWQEVLINMLKATKKLKVNNVGVANVNKQQIHLLDIYFEWFLNEIQLLMRQGLIKQYYTKSGNVKSLKGKLEFAAHLNQNLIHKEQFYTRHQVYDLDHHIHQVLGLALEIITHFSKGNYLYSKCKKVELNFPEVSRISASIKTFSKIKRNRKTKPYETAIEIARLIILNYAPNISSGKEKMMALLFDMNSLWEEYILIQLKRAVSKNVFVYGQSSKPFWNGITIRPDIIITKGDDVYVIDTKWKNIQRYKPSSNDLRQMYVYNDYWKAKKALLLYPSLEKTPPEFKLYEGDCGHECAIGRLNILESGKLNPNVGHEILGWFEK